MALFYSYYTYGYMNVYPVTFDKRIDGLGETEEYTITNTTNKILKYRFYVEPSEHNDMSKWIELYPESLILKPGQEKKVKLYINSPTDTKEGEYSATLGIKELGIPKITKENNLLEVYTNLKMKIYGYVGELPIKLNFKDFKVAKDKDIKLMGKIENISKRRVDLEFLYINGKDEYILAEERIRKDETLDLESVSLYLDNIIIKGGKIVIRDKKEHKLLKEIAL